MNRDLPSSSRAGRGIQVATDAVVAAYIHEISERHRPPEPAAEEAPSSPPGRVSRFCSGRRAAHAALYARCATPLS